MLKVTHQSLHGGVRDHTSGLSLHQGRPSSEAVVICLKDKDGMRQEMSDSTYSVSPSSYRQLIALLLSPKKMHEKISIASVSVGWALAWEGLSPWGFILTGWTLRPTALCSGAEGGQSRGVRRFCRHSWWSVPIPCFPSFSPSRLCHQLSSALCWERTVGWPAAPGTGWIVHCGGSDTLGVSAGRSLSLCCTCDGMS